MILPSEDYIRGHSKDDMFNKVRFLRVLSYALWAKNALATFVTLINRLFQLFLNKFLVVYLDDIVIYSNTLKDHVEHLRQDFSKLRKNKLYVKKEKCAFSQHKVTILRHVVGDGKLRLDKSKVQAIHE